MTSGPWLRANMKPLRYVMSEQCKVSQPAALADDTHKGQVTSLSSAVAEAQRCHFRAQIVFRITSCSLSDCDCSRITLNHSVNMNIYAAG